MYETKTINGMRTLRGAIGLLVLLLTGATALGQRQPIPSFLKDPALRGNRANEKKTVTDGNRIRITVHNTGLVGGTGEVRGEWPAGSEDFYIGDVLPVIAMEVPIDLDGDAAPDSLVRRVITTRGPRAGVQGPPPGADKFYGLEPMGGFAASDGVNEKPAVATEPSTWPTRWPDQPTWINPATGKAEWNGFFGRGIQNADFETYFWMDDHQDERLFRRYGFLPDTTDLSRLGQGIAVKVRALQWSQFLAQDATYFVYEVTNTGTTVYPRVSVGLTAGTLAGGDGDSQDDVAFFDQANRIVYSYDFDNSGNRGQPVGIVGYAFMESPGNPLDGIDNDGDGDPTLATGRDLEGRPFITPGLEGVGNVFTPADFQPRVLQPGDPLILIDADTFRRTITYMGDGPTTVVSQGITYSLSPGVQLAEKLVQVRQQVVTEKNLIDDDLDGLIDEDIYLHYERRAQNFQGEVINLPSLRYRNYVGMARDIRGRQATQEDSLRHGFLNRMLDESNDDGMDNDGDWNVLTDDVGADGKSGTGDAGEGDGEPTPGEPNFDALDVNETDQVGLASFFYFTPPGALVMNRDDLMWEVMSPGYFTTNEELERDKAAGGVDGDFIFGSGYFRLEPGQTLRFSLALVFGGGQTFAQQLQNITNNVVTVQDIYNRNYKFARPPEKPTLSGVPGDGKVTLYWDSVSEESVDPILGKDFQGYKVYRSTDPNFLDPRPVTDKDGNPSTLAPIAQFDLSDGVKGLWQGDYDVYQRVKGVPFDLGADTGLRYSFVDTEVQNGQTYYYAVSAYDRGSESFYPAETNFPVTVGEDGTVRTDRNVVRVVPNAPVLGYEAGDVLDAVSHGSGPATGEIFVEVLDPRAIPDGSEYSVSFEEEASGAVSLFSITMNDAPLLSRISLGDATSTIFDGIRLNFRNDAPRLNLDATGWASAAGKKVMFVARANVSQWRYEGTTVPFDYEIRFSDEVVGQSIGGFRLGSRGPNAVAAPAQFTVFNMTANRPAQFVFYEPNAASANGRFDDNEFIFIYEEVAGQPQPTFAIRVDDIAGPGSYPVAGDVFRVRTYKPFTTADSYAFTTKGAKVNELSAKEQLDRIKVVPNPYVAAASWEGRLPPTITSGRGERRIDFIHLPAGAKIRIMNARGELVQSLEHSGSISDGTVTWDLRTREGLDAAFGVYFYHVEAPGLGETTGKLALIK